MLVALTQFVLLSGNRCMVDLMKKIFGRTGFVAALSVAILGQSAAADTFRYELLADYFGTGTVSPVMTVVVNETGFLTTEGQISARNMTLMASGSSFDYFSGHSLSLDGAFSDYQGSDALSCYGAGLESSYPRCLSFSTGAFGFTAGPTIIMEFDAAAGGGAINLTTDLDGLMVSASVFNDADFFRHSAQATITGGTSTSEYNSGAIMETRPAFLRSFRNGVLMEPLGQLPPGQSVATIPLPLSLAGLLMGLGALGLVRRKV